MAIERKDIHHFNYFLYGEAFYGSHKGLRYRLGTEPLDNIFFKKPEEREGYILKAYAWKEPDNFNTAREKENADFPLSEEGICEAIAWLNEKYDGWFGV